jgi:hypothetical protein
MLKICLHVFSLDQTNQEALDAYCSLREPVATDSLGSD